MEYQMWTERRERLVPEMHGRTELSSGHLLVNCYTQEDTHVFVQSHYVGYLRALAMRYCKDSLPLLSYV